MNPFTPLTLFFSVLALSLALPSGQDAAPLVQRQQQQYDTFLELQPDLSAGFLTDCCAGQTPQMALHLLAPSGP